MSQSHANSVRVLGIKDNVLSFLTKYYIEYVADSLESGSITPSDVLVCCIGKDGNMVMPDSVYDIENSGFVVISYWDSYLVYYSQAIMSVSDKQNHTNICVLDMSEESSGEHDFLILRKDGINEYTRLFESTEHKVCDRFCDPTAQFITKDVIEITYDMDDSTNEKGGILYNISNGKSYSFIYNSGLSVDEYIIRYHND